MWVQSVLIVSCVGIVCLYGEFVWAVFPYGQLCGDSVCLWLVYVGTACTCGELCGHSLSLWLVVRA